MQGRSSLVIALLLVFAACSDNPDALQPTAPGAAAIEKGATDQPDVRGRYIVVFHDAVSDVDGTIDRLVRDSGARVHYRYHHALKGFAATIPAPALEGIRRNPMVSFVEADAIVTKNNQSNPPSWGLDRIDQRTLPLDFLYSYQNTGSGVRVYIIDTGIRFSHQEFGGRAVSGYDFVDNDADASDCDGHGTHVAGTVGGASVGVAKGATMVAVRVLNCNGSGTVSGVVAGINWVAANHISPAVANMSLGGGNSSSIVTAVENAIAAGVTFVVSAGNSNANACNYSPANAPSAITVGASTSGDVRSWFSNYGSCVDIFAPGSSIYSSTNDANNSYDSWDGTSMASPHVAGVAALFLQTNTTATPTQVSNAILGNATTGVLSSLGTGSPNLLLYSLITGPVTPPPSAPTGLSATATSSSAIALSWTDNANDETGFKIERSSNGGTTWSLLATLGANVTTYSNTGLPSGSTYAYRVYAYNSNGNSAYSNTASATTQSTLVAVHVGALSGYTTGNSNNWYGKLLVTVHNSSHSPVSGVTVTGNLGGRTVSGVTNSSGQVTLSTARLRSNTASVSMSVTSLSGSGFSYNSGANDVPSLSVTVNRP